MLLLVSCFVKVSNLPLDRIGCKPNIHFCWLFFPPFDVVVCFARYQRVFINWYLLLYDSQCTCQAYFVTFKSTDQYYTATFMNVNIRNIVNLYKTESRNAEGKLNSCTGAHPCSLFRNGECIHNSKRR